MIKDGWREHLIKDIKNYDTPAGRRALADATKQEYRKP